MTDQPSSDTDSHDEAGYRFSFPYGFPIIVYPLLLVLMLMSVDAWWGVLVQLGYAALMGFFIWQAMNEKEYQTIHAKDPSLNRLTWRLNWLIFFVALPAVPWSFLVFMYWAGYWLGIEA